MSTTYAETVIARRPIKIQHRHGVGVETSVRQTLSVVRLGDGPHRAPAVPVGPAAPVELSEPTRSARAERRLVRTRSRVRLTPRGRRLLRTGIVVSGVLVALVLFVFARGTASAGSTATGPAPAGDASTTAGLTALASVPATVRLVVQPGQTLWSISATALPDLDARAAVSRVAALNGLRPEAHLRPGQALVLPAPAA